MEFIKKEKNDNSVEFRIKFGRDKAAVMSQVGKYFYVNLYDNRAKYKGNHIFFGIDELEELTKIIEAMNNLKSEFSEVNLHILYHCFYYIVLECVLFFNLRIFFKFILFFNLRKL